MKLEQQVVSLDLSKQLKEAGYPQEGLWFWAKTSEDGEKWVWELGRWANGYIGDKIIAPTVAELGEALPSWFEDKSIIMFNDCDQWFVQFRKDAFGKMIRDCNDEILANAMAEMWLYLKKEKLI